ncbi:MAG TPA: MFS transporter [Candidatus Mediterraneibacter stercoripullorum]|nr:MFS transporter [Candidatus Mediterraneibacter stercoripullorum]
MVQILLVIIYISFISLGLPDALLGSAWPSMYGEMGVPVSFAGVISMIIALGTIISSLQSDRVTRKLGAGVVTAVSVAMTAAALFGFSISDSFFALCLWAVPYGLGAGSVDAALNNYVALHYTSRDMSWLHCMWGVGTIVGPNVMGYALTNGMTWNRGYFYISLLQIVLSAALFLSLPIWKKMEKEKGIVKQPEGQEKREKALTLKEIIAIPGAKEIMIAFFCYCAVEQTAMLWGSSYMVLHNGISAERAAAYASLFCIGITAGRFVSGFLTMRFSDRQMIRGGQTLIITGIVVLVLPLGSMAAVAGLVMIGLGCAPVYPCIIHSTPACFGPERSQALIGVQMASAYVGTCLMPPLFGLIANHISASLLPVYLLVIAVLMTVMYTMVIKKTCAA